MSALKKLIPLADRVLVRRMIPATKTAGGIILPDAGDKKSSEGEVLAVGPGYRGHNGDLIPTGVAVGDKVLLPDFGGMELKSQGEGVFLFRGDEILAKFE
mmetsp:Transcript_17302/g.28940  ORF Transcript_17302/g.28940 Transcript_17302/m.28940 type:complete len:100 (+) Transcript_17302:30-329(+)